MEERSPYKPVRALARGLALLQELNEAGMARPAGLARACGIDRTTAYRLLATLESMHLVRRNASNDEYTLTEQVRSLSDGFTERDRTIQIVANHLGRLFPKVLWPTDFATFDRGAMVIRETTHRFSPYSIHRAMVGKPRPLFATALGRAALAGADEDQRRVMLEILAGVPTQPAGSPRQIASQTEYLLRDFRERGYGWAVGQTDGKISAIAVPVRMKTEVAAVNVLFFTSAMSIETAAARFLEPLQDCARSIESDLSEKANEHDGPAV